MDKIFDNLPYGTHFTDSSGRKFIKLFIAQEWHGLNGDMFYYDRCVNKVTVNSVDYAGIPVNVPWDAEVVELTLDEIKPSALDKVNGCDIIIPDFGKHKNQQTKQQEQKANMKLEEAVVNAITELRPRGSFSAFDVTTQIRDAANNGAIDLPGLEARPNQHNIKFWVNHQDVRAIIDEMLTTGQLNSLGLQDVRYNGTYREFVFDMNPPAPVIATPTPTVQTIGTVSTPPTPANSTVDVKVQSYLDKCNACPTLKMVQSAIKVNGITCEQFKTIVENLGYTVNGDGSDNYSTYYVQI